MVHVSAVPEQPPPQATNLELNLGIAFNVNVVPLLNASAQCLPQPIPAHLHQSDSDLFL
jgi:hypothetical protein